MAISIIINATANVKGRAFGDEIVEMMNHPVIIA
jgi:hypothetical protein